MIALSLIILLLVTTSLLFARCIKAAAIIMTATFIFFVLIGNGILPFLLVKNFEQSSLPEIVWRNNNAIVVLGSPGVKTPIFSAKIREAAVLYFSCISSGKKCRVVASGGDSLHTGLSEAVSYKGALIELGVPAMNIELETNSLNTYQNAEFSAQYLKRNLFDQVVLVTLMVHLKRAQLFFNHFGVKVLPIPADSVYVKPSLFPRASNLVLMEAMVHEYGGLIEYFIYNFLGLNPIPTGKNK